jgi:uncharacterized membrane-anchored protein
MRNTLFLAILAASLCTAGIADASKAPPAAKPPKAAAGGVVGGLVGDAPADAKADKADGDQAAADDGPGDAEPSDEESEAEIAKAHAEFESTLHFQTGTVTLVGGKVKLELPEGYRYLDPADTEKVIVKWGNLAGQKTQGMILPKGESLWEQASLAVIVEYVDDGHVSDDDAAKIDYTKLLEQMRQATHEENTARKKAGLAEMELVGWAEPPHYDKATRKLYWAKDYTASDSEAHALNYSVRVLGREGVLELDCISDMRSLPAAKVEMQRLLGFADFTAGNTYADFKKGHDRTAEYGIAAVVAGGIAAKVLGGKGFIAILLAAKKFIILGLVAAAAFFKKLFARLAGRKDATPASVAVHIEKGPGEP